MKAESLAQALLADRKRQTVQPNTSIDCFACGRSFTYRGPNGDDSGRFCGRVCREAYDRGYRQPPPLDVFSVKWPSPIKAGSKSGSIPNDELIRPRRTCVSCGGKIPVWHKGRKVSERRKKCLTCSG